MKTIVLAVVLLFACGGGGHQVGDSCVYGERQCGQEYNSVLSCDASAMGDSGHLFELASRCPTGTTCTAGYCK